MNGLRLLLDKPGIGSPAETEEERLARTIAQAESISTEKALPSRAPAAATQMLSGEREQTTKTTEEPKISSEASVDIVNRLAGLESKAGNIYKNANDILKAKLEQAQDLEKAERSGSQERISKALEEYEKGDKKEMTMGGLFARALIGLAPQLIGAVAGKGMGIGVGAGGLAGAQGGLAGLKYLEDQEEKARERGDTVAVAKYKAQVEREKERLKPYSEQVEGIRKEMTQLPSLEAKTLSSIAQQDPQLALKIAQSSTTPTKTTEVKATDKQEKFVPQPKGAGSQAQKGSSDLGFGIKLYDDATKEDRKQAQKVVARYGAVDSAFDDVIQALEKANIKSITKWTDAGRELSSKLALLSSGIIDYTNRGATLSSSEKELVDSLGISLEGNGSIAEKFRISLEPKALAERLKKVKASVRKGAVGQATTYRAYDSTAPQKKVEMTSEQRKARLKEIEERMKVLQKGAQ